MRGAPAAVADRMARRHRAAGVDLRAGTGVTTLERRPERAARLALCDLAFAVLSRALWMLGIAVPRRM